MYVEIRRVDDPLGEVCFFQAHLSIFLLQTKRASFVSNEEGGTSQYPSRHPSLPQPPSQVSNMKTHYPSLTPQVSNMNIHYPSLPQVPNTWRSTIPASLPSVQHEDPLPMKIHYPSLMKIHYPSLPPKCPTWRSTIPASLPCVQHEDPLSRPPSQMPNMQIHYPSLPWMILRMMLDFDDFEDDAGSRWFWGWCWILMILRTLLDFDDFGDDA